MKVAAIAFLLARFATGQARPPVVSPTENIHHMSADVDDAAAYSLRPDGKGPYTWQEHSRVFENGLALFVCTEVKTCSTLPQAGPAGSETNRALLIDLSQSAEGRARKLGVIRATDATLIVFWEQDKTRRMIYGVNGIEGFATRDARTMPVGETHASERTELRFFIDGAQHILQFGPWTAGQFQKNQGPFNGAGTTQATITRAGENHFTVRSPEKSVGRLWDNRNPDRPVDLGLYALSFTVSFSSVPAGRYDDEAAVKSIVDHWRQAWEQFDGSVLRGDYADDADWLNAFGVRKKGAEIVSFVSQVVKRPGVEGRRTTWGEIHVRFVRPDVAVAYRDYQTLGMKAVDGRDLGERRTHANWLLTKEGGKWRIATHVISDEL